MLVGCSGQEVVQSLVGAAVPKKCAKYSFDGRGSRGCRTLKANEAGLDRVVTGGSSDSETEGIVHLAFAPDLFSFEANVGEVMVGAAVAASGDIDFDVVREFREAVLKMSDELPGELFGFCDSELAELSSGAGDGSARER